MSDAEVGNDKRRVKTAGRVETSWAGVCISLPLSTQVELQEVGVFLRQRDGERSTRRRGDMWREGGRLSEAGEREGGMVE